MGHRQFAVVLLLLFGALLPPSETAGTTLTFDNVGFSGNSGQFSGNIYIGQGALISSDGSYPLTYMNNLWRGFLSHSLPYGVAFGDNPSGEQWGTIRIDFVDPITTQPVTARYVSLWAGDASSESETIIARAFGGTNNLLVADTFVTGYQPGDLPSQAELNLYVTGISYVTISTTHCVSLDDVSFHIEGKSILVYSTADALYPTDYYPRALFADLTQILTTWSVDVTDRAQTPEITTALLQSYDELWLMTADEDIVEHFSAQEIAAILNFRQAGHGLLIASDHAQDPQYSFQDDANQIAIPLGVQFRDRVDHSQNCIAPTPTAHPVYASVNAVFGHDSEGEMAIQPPNYVVAEYVAGDVIDTLAAAQDNGEGRIIFDASFVKFLNDYVHQCDDSLYCNNLADWLLGQHPAESSGFVLDHVDGMTTDSQLVAGVPITFHLRLRNLTGQSILGATNGFRVYSPDGAQWTATVADTNGNLGASQFDGGFFINSFSIDGSGSDTVGFGGSSIASPGVPNGFDEVVYTITIGPIDVAYNGSHICLDSSFYRPFNNWLWSLSPSPGTNYYPSWGGPYCFAIAADPDGDGIPGADDNCPAVYNPDQMDSDGDSFGDACDLCPGYDDRNDTDIDGVPDDCDNCYLADNSNQEDTDGDGFGDLCDCCIQRGDIKHDGSVVVSDLTYLVSYMFKGGPEPVCIIYRLHAPICPYSGGGYRAEADINGDASCGPNVSDLTYLVSFLFRGGPDPIPCQ